MKSEKRRVFGGGSNWMSRKKRTSPQFHKIVTAVSITPKSHSSADEIPSFIPSLQTQYTRENESSGFTPQSTKRRKTFGGRKAPRVVDTQSDDIFFSPSILCLNKITKQTIDDLIHHKAQEYSYSSSTGEKSSFSNNHPSDRSLCRKLPFTMENVEEDPKLAADESINISLISDGFSISNNSDSDPQGMDSIPPSDNEFDCGETTTHFKTHPKRIKQPSSTKTSIAEARAYFARLDASPLLLETVSDTEEHNQVIRTRRRLLPTHPLVMEEYKTYENACLCAQVPPMSLQEFSRNRGKFKTHDTLYEGFLDADD